MVNLWDCPTFHVLLFIGVYMVTVDSSGRIRLSSQLVKSAGFRPGQSLAVVANSKNSFDIISASKAPKNGDWAAYSVEQDGRVRVAKSTLSNMGVNGKRKNITADSKKGSITVSM